MSPAGGPPATALQLKVAEVLRDGQWHRYEEVLAKAGVVIPPGVAIRRTEHKRTLVRSVRDLEAAPRQRPMTVEQQIASGRRSLVSELLASRKKGRPHHYERKGDMVRMLSVPPRVAAAWEAMERGQWFDPEAMADRLQDEPHTSLDGLLPSELRRLVGVLVDRLGEREEDPDDGQA